MGKHPQPHMPHTFVPPPDSLLPDTGSPNSEKYESIPRSMHHVSREGSSLSVPTTGGMMTDPSRNERTVGDTDNKSPGSIVDRDEGLGGYESLDRGEGMDMDVDQEPRLGCEKLNHQDMMLPEGRDEHGRYYDLH